VRQALTANVARLLAAAQEQQRAAAAAVKAEK